ncbi:MAG: T9SS type A sorting domain-containing protein [Bacteroidia bacterium]|nr:T9SS type A sorting domain-containing protein [Bacteroidia bacterium]
MHIIKDFKRLSFIAFILVGVLGSVYAGDDEKKGDKKNKNSIIKIDSSDTELDLDIIDQEDTLVFDDWEIPGENFENEATKIVTLGGINGNHSSSYSLAEAKDKLTNYSFGFKKEYKVDFTIFPNPSSSQINIKASVNAKAIRITDITGKEHLTSSFTNQIDIMDLPIGTYFIQLIYHDHVESRKFIKS